MRLRTAVAAAVASVMLAAAPAAADVLPASGHTAGYDVRAAAVATSPHVDRAGASGSLTIPALGTGRIPVRRVSAAAGAIQIPANVRTVGWWRGSRPFRARQGSSVIVGHVSGAGDAPGALYRLPKLHRGNRIVWRVGGQRKVFRVVAKTYTRRTAELPDRVWRLDGRRSIHLITCARKRIESDGFYHYTHNLTVTAVLVSGS